ncbi:hypothetical protein R8G64_05240 [Tenacibaculum maritimum]|uniref:hypothetical protein n=1 Tax=Tenacibaculum maritimum TaxID=107401 RepID=UPI0012E53D13|nr:hypothetical protein [Tenacibaculum maritimum]CAA0233977.1 conserved hypothetical protein [Tenacibaculum maritimum]
MKTKIEAILDKVHTIKLRIADIMGVTHTQDDYSIYIKGIGGEIEKFLKDAVFNNGLNNLNFYNLIERLRSLGITESSISNLHELRNYYNSLKHEPGFITNIIEAEEKVEKLIEALTEIDTKSIGNINATYTQNTSRVLWLCAWDDYMGGMTEINLFLPNYELDFPYSVEYFNIALEGWETLKDKYVPNGELQLGKEFVSEKAYNIWSANVDMIGVGRFRGDVKDLVKTLSSLVNKEREEKLLEDLKRKNDSFSVFASIAYAIQDTLINDNWKDFEDFKDEVRLRIDFDYGIELDSKTLNFYMNKLRSDLISSDRNLLNKTDEILWLSAEQFKNQSVMIHVMEKPSIVINTENKIAVKMK